MNRLNKLMICLFVQSITIFESTLAHVAPLPYINHETYFMSDGKSNTMTLNYSQTSGLSAKQTTVYSAYGHHNKSLSSNVNLSFTYDGEYQDPATHLVYLRARDYGSSLQRFTTMDSYHVWNKYNFADANPIMNIDPSGHLSFSALMLISLSTFIFGWAVIGASAMWLGASAVQVISSSHIAFGMASAATFDGMIAHAQHQNFFTLSSVLDMIAGGVIGRAVGATRVVSIVRAAGAARVARVVSIVRAAGAARVARVVSIVRAARAAREAEALRSEAAKVVANRARRSELVVKAEEFRTAMGTANQSLDGWRLDWAGGRSGRHIPLEPLPRGDDVVGVERQQLPGQLSTIPE